MPFAGFDVARYPGTDVMKALYEQSNLEWVGFYLPVAGPGLDDKKTWLNTCRTLRSIGWGVAPIYIGKQPNSHSLASVRGHEQDNGALDGLEAANFAMNEGMPARTVIYFDQEIPSSDPAWLSHYLGWATAVYDRGYKPGLYCSFTIAQAIGSFIEQRNPKAKPEIWVWNINQYPAGQSYSDLNKIPAPDPRGAGGGGSSWQYVQGSSLRILGRTISPVDFDSSDTRDPGHFGGLS